VKHIVLEILVLDMAFSDSLVPGSVLGSCTTSNGCGLMIKAFSERLVSLSFYCNNSNLLLGVKFFVFELLKPNRFCPVDTLAKEFKTGVVRVRGFILVSRVYIYYWCIEISSITRAFLQTTLLVILPYPNPQDAMV